LWIVFLLKPYVKPSEKNCIFHNFNYIFKKQFKGKKMLRKNKKNYS